MEKAFSRRSIRLPGYDYAQPGGYFVTLCVEDSRELLSKVDDGEILLSPLGKIIEREWRKLPERFSDLTLDEFVIMPNHLHGILIINESAPTTPETDLLERARRGTAMNLNDSVVQSQRRAPTVEGNTGINTHHLCHMNIQPDPTLPASDTPVLDRRGTAMSRNEVSARTYRRAPTRRGPSSEGFGQPIPGSLPTIIRSFKSSATLRVNLIQKFLGQPFWQRNYYEHVIQDDDSLETLRLYIHNNPINWSLDEYYSRAPARIT